MRCRRAAVRMLRRVRRTPAARNPCPASFGSGLTTRSGYSQYLMILRVTRTGVDLSRRKEWVMADRPVALVTGANKGLGKETARQLLGRGMTVVMGSRDPERGIAAAWGLCTDGASVPVRLDVTDSASVEEVADRL